MVLELSLANLISFAATVLLSVTGFFLKEALRSLKDVQRCQLEMAQRLAKIEGKCEANHDEGKGK